VRLRFGDCALDTEARALTRAGAPVGLPPKALRLLEVLIEKRPAAVSQAELRDLLWPRTYVGHTSLARLVTQVRQALGDATAEPRLLRTVRGFGYAFAGSVETAGEDRSSEAGCAFKLRTAAGEIALAEGENLIGRDRECRVRIASDMASRRHARVTVSGPRAVLEDLASKNGTRLNGRRLAQPAELAVGDEILIGHDLLVLAEAGPSAATKTDAAPAG
jgi:DNA-binding winged helix-turn-helix (wHTH) protein